jgi:aminomethyltransferase
MRSYRFAPGEVAGIACLVARTGYTGEDGFELFCASEKGPALWDALMAAGGPEGITPCGLGARDSLRLEMAYRLYGSDMDDSTTRKVGEVTSGTKSPSLGTSIGLAYVPTALAAEGSAFQVDIRGRAAAARVVKTPFYLRK